MYTWVHTLIRNVNVYVLPHAMPAACFIVMYCTYIYIQCNFFYLAMALMSHVYKCQRAFVLHLIHVDKS